MNNSTTQTSYAANIANYEVSGSNATQIPDPSFSLGDRALAINLSRMETPATTVWVADGNGSREFAWANTGTQPTISTTGSPRTLNTIVERHLDTTCVLYCDGHVKSVKLDALTKLGLNNTYSAFSVQADPD